MNRVIVFATPVFLLLIALEFAWGRARGRNTYRLPDAISSILLGMLSQIAGVFLVALKIGLYSLVYSLLWQQVTPGAGGSVGGWGQAMAAFWSTWPGWITALLLYDFCYYWLHRAGHEVALLWAAHAVHHQSQDYNLSTALRQTGSGLLLGWVFYLPMALLGVPPLLFGIVGLVDLLYQFWVHTEHVPKLGWFDRWFCSPSNHRVHHAVNERYLDRNYGGILVVWDRLFGSFQEERDDEPCVYGTRQTLQSWDPLWANLAVYADRARDCWHAASWADKLRVWIKPAGWRPAEVAARFPKPAFELAAVVRYDTPLTRGEQVFAGLQFVAVLQAVAGFLWIADSAAAPLVAMAGAASAGAAWALGAWLQRRLSAIELLVIETALVSTLSAAAGWTEVHLVFKPLTMLLALAWVWTALRADAGAEAGARTASSEVDAARTALPKGSLLQGPARWLLLALLCSGIGDVLLMLPGLFVPGLVAFLCAHLAYLALLRHDAAWLPSKPALVAVAAVGALMLAVLFTGGLPAALRGPVAAYVLVISLMAAQAIGRAIASQGPTRPAALLVAAGALCFMASDSMLAIDRFVSPLPHARWWVLASYYAAQVLIVHGMLKALRSRLAREDATVRTADTAA